MSLTFQWKVLDVTGCVFDLPLDVAKWYWMSRSGTGCTCVFDLPLDVAAGYWMSRNGTGCVFEHPIGMVHDGTGCVFDLPMDGTM